MSLTWWFWGGIGVSKDSQLPLGPQQSGADQQQQDGREYLDQGSGVCQRGEEETVQAACSDTVAATAPVTVVELTVGFGPDAGAGSLSRPLPGESAQREHVLPVVLQAVDGDGLPPGVRHRHAEQVWRRQSFILTRRRCWRVQ